MALPLALFTLVICLAAVCAAPAGAWAPAFWGQPLEVGATPYSVATGDFNGDGIRDLVTANSGDNTVSVLRSNGDGSFGARTDFATGLYPISVAVGDFNRDGKLDLVTANGDNSVSVLLGNGDGSFGAKTDFAPVAGPQSAPYCVAVGDFNRDGKLDLATANYNASTVSVLLGNGDGTFGAKTEFATVYSEASVAVGDFNADGKPDLVATNGLFNTVSVLLGNGDGTFAAKTDFATGIGPGRVTVGDLNGDGKLDLATANSGANTVSVLLGNGDGTFAAKTDFATGIGPNSVAVGDFNGDGKQDLVTANYSANTVSVLLGNGAGSFGAKTDFATGANPYCVTVGDFNGDGKPDLATANETANTVSVLLGNGAGSFGPQPAFATGSGPQSVAGGDFNGDGNLDLATANYNTSTASVLLANGNGTFGAKSDYAIGSGSYSVAGGDFNGDGRLDLVTANYGAGTVSVLLGNGNGTFGAKSDFAIGANPYSVAVGDFNGDGKPDLVTANVNAGTVSVLLGNGNGTFGAQSAFATGSGPHSVAVGDFNGDGRLDLVTANYGANTASVLLGNGAGGIGARSDFATGSVPYSVAVGDFNGDGRLDLVTANVNASTVSVLLGDGNGHVAARTDIATGADPFSVAVGDFNGDGKLDLATANWSAGSVSVLLGDGNGHVAARADIPTSATLVSVVAGDFNGDGKLDLATASAGASTVSVLLNGGPGPAGTMLLSGGAAATASTGVEIDSSVSGATQMRLRDSGGAWSAWQAYDRKSRWTVPGGDGSKTVEVQYRDALGQMLTLSDSITLDTTAPSTTDDAPAGWQTSGLTVTLTPSDGSGSGVATTQHKLDGATSWSTGTSVVVSGDGTHTIAYRSIDMVGNTEDQKSATVKIDTAAPVTSDDAPAGWCNAALAVHLSASDGGSGMSGGQAKTQYELDGAPSWTSGASVVVSGDGVHTIAYRSIDMVGNTEDQKSATVKIDTSAPVTTDNAPSGWRTTSPVTVTLTPDDGSGSGMSGGLAKTQHKLDGASSWSTGTSIDVSGDGVHTVAYRSIDAVGNTEDQKSCTVKIDSAAPVTVQSGADGDWHRYPVTVVFNASDGSTGSGVGQTEYRLGGGSWIPAAYVTVANEGDNTLDYRSHDVAGNTETYSTVHVKIDTTAPSTRDDAPAGWRNTAVTVTLTPDDGSGSGMSSGLAKTQYKLDGATSWSTGTAVVVSGSAVHSLAYRSMDALGNTEEQRSCTVRIDTNPPTTSVKAAAVKRNNTATITYEVLDAPPNAGSADVTITMKTAKGKTAMTPVVLPARTVNSWLTYKFRCTLAKGTYTMRVTAVDGAGNAQVGLGGSAKLVVS